MTAPDAHIEPTGALRAWLARFDLLDLWQMTAELPPNRADYYKVQILRVYVAERRKAERSHRFQIERAL